MQRALSNSIFCAAFSVLSNYCILSKPSLIIYSLQPREYTTCISHRKKGHFFLIEIFTCSGKSLRELSFKLKFRRKYWLSGELLGVKDFSLLVPRNLNGASCLHSSEVVISSVFHEVMGVFFHLNAPRKEAVVFVFVF